MILAENTPHADEFLEFVLRNHTILHGDAFLYLVSAFGLMTATAAQAQFALNLYADTLAYEASRQIKAEIEAWASERRRDPNGNFVPWPFADSLGVKKMDLAREFFAVAMEAENRLLRLTYHPHDRTHWIFNPFEPEIGAFYEKVVVTRRRNIRRAVSDACDCVIAKISARNRGVLEAIGNSEDHE
jgi:hypothetical protein